MALARDLLVAPPDASPAAAPDGSAVAPWPSVGEALNQAQGGDRILLMNGEYGALGIGGADFDTAVTIMPRSENGAHVTQVSVANSHNLVIRGLNVWPLEEGRRRRLVTTQSNASQIRFEDLDIRGAPNAPEAYLDWTREDWTRNWNAQAVRLEGPDNAVVGSRITGISFGITTLGPRAEVRGNTITGFGGDAMRGLGDGSVFAQNLARDCVKVSDNHDDGFQSWAPKDAPSGTPVTGIVLEANTIFEWTGPEDHPLRCVLQGIGLFDGPYRDFTIRNNLIVVSAWHGITAQNAEGVEIVNNTVLFPGGLSHERPWIRVNPAEGAGNRVLNNLAMAYRDIPGAQRSNGVVVDTLREFRDPLGGDYRLREGSAFIGAADPDAAPETDIEGTARPQAAAPDLGAYQSR
ncbi:right-handed parallel beta-helix repeat-containing protein [Pseudoroseicyclus aestuarii]|uniref:right-handed parallel beta-helix repeat-containing protein n=1 Tax=Pseudoroseicyclus aestuarii TaxID=1795041 RepID=UPI0015E8846F|nr:right-handed parallel beta-helix repeat-containing protein [Pseudoroseicyclus aestuarii]